MSSSGDRLPRMLGPYVLLERLGSGAYGTAYFARELDAQQPLALKRLRDDALHREDLRARLRHEARVAVAIDNPHVVRALDVGVAGEVPYVAMAYVPGWPLVDVMRASHETGEIWAPGASVALIAAALDGLQAVHDAVDPTTGDRLDAVHRDLSPSNVMLRPDGRPVLIDLGLGRSALREWETSTGTLLGTPGYMAPEQILRRVVDHRADLYAVAVLAFELLTLDRYVAAADAATMMRATLDGPFRPPSQRVRTLPRALDRVLERALQVSPAERFPTAAALREALCSVIVPTTAAVKACIPGALQRAYAEVHARRSALLGAPFAPAEPVGRTMVFARASRRAPTAVLPASDPSPAPDLGFIAGVAEDATAVAFAMSAGLEGDFAPTDLKTRPGAGRASADGETALMPTPTRALMMEPTSVPPIAQTRVRTPASAALLAPATHPWLPRGGLVAVIAVGAASVAVTLAALLPDPEGDPLPRAVEVSAPAADLVVPLDPEPRVVIAGVSGVANATVTATSAPPAPAAARAVDEPPASTSPRVTRTHAAPRAATPTDGAKPTRRPQPSSAPAAEVGGTAQPARARLEAVIERANARRRRHPEERAALDALIADASAWLGSTDEARLAAAALRLEQRLAQP